MTGAPVAAKRPSHILCNEFRNGLAAGLGKLFEPAAVVVRQAIVLQAEQSQQGIVGEFVDFLRYNKKWWLTPIMLIILLAGLLVILAGTVGPFIYPGV